MMMTRELQSDAITFWGEVVGRSRSSLHRVLVVLVGAVETVCRLTTTRAWFDPPGYPVSSSSVMQIFFKKVLVTSFSLDLFCF